MGAMHEWCHTLQFWWSSKGVLHLKCWRRVCFFVQAQVSVSACPILGGKTLSQV